MARRTTVTIIVTFDAAHQLPLHSGRCASLHGHTYRLELTVSGAIQADGMVVDFGKLKHVLNEMVVDKIDHSFLNNVIHNPTAENVAIYIHDELVSAGVKPAKLRLWETPSAYVTVYGDE